MTYAALSVVVHSILTEPTPEALTKLQPLLLALDTPSARAAHDISGQFYRYLSTIRNLMEARQFPLLATSLSLTSTGIGIAEEVFSERKTNMMKVMTDGLRMALDTLGTYQFVRQWEPSFAAVHDHAVWNLYEAYWQLSTELQPNLSHMERTEAMESLFVIVRDTQADSALRLALLVRLFQWGLLVRLVPLLHTLKGAV